MMTPNRRRNASRTSGGRGEAPETAIRTDERSSGEPEAEGVISPKQAETLAETLSSGRWTHDYPISAAEAKQLGLPVTTDMPDDVLEMMSLYPQPVRQSRGGVEYRPVPRKKEVGRPLPARGDAE